MSVKRVGIFGTSGMAREAGVPVLVDPKGEDFRRYRGATVLTPNDVCSGVRL